MGRLRRHLVLTYLAVDPRSLGLFRICVGVTLLADLLRRYLGVDYWYTDQGIVTGKLLAEADVSYMTSPFVYAGTRAQAVSGMIVCGVVYLLFTAGFKTRLFHFLSLFAVVSLNNRILILENGGQATLNLLCTWSLFLPLGRRFSVDALLASLRARRENTPEELTDREALRPQDPPIVSLAVLALLLQLATIYFFNAFQKFGLAWYNGSAVRAALYHEQFVTVFGVWMRESVPYPILQIMTWSTLALEWTVSALILSPLWTRRLRLAAIALLPPLHAMFQACLHVGVFSLAMISFYPLLLSREDWEWLAERRRGVHRGLTAHFDADCGLCFLFARIFARLDSAGRVRLASNRQAPLPAGVTRGIADRAIVVVDGRSGRVSIGAAGIAKMIGALPLGAIASLPLRLPGLRQAAAAIYDLVARNRVSLSRRMGLSACGTPAPRREEPAAQEPVPAWVRGPGILLREAAVVVLMVAAVGDLARNPGWPERLRYRQPALLNTLVFFPWNRQLWYMFAPEPSMFPRTIAVEAETVDGRVVDPYNEVASRYPAIPPPDGHSGLPPRLGQNQFFAAYSLRITEDDCTGYFPDLRAWIFRYSERTGRPEDRIVRFKVWRVMSKSPEPGSSVRTRMTRKLLLSVPEME